MQTDEVLNGRITYLEPPEEIQMLKEQIVTLKFELESAQLANRTLHRQKAALIERIHGFNAKLTDLLTLI